MVEDSGGDNLMSLFTSLHFDTRHLYYGASYSREIHAHYVRKHN